MFLLLRCLGKEFFYFFLFNSELDVFVLFVQEVENLCFWWLKIRRRHILTSLWILVLLRFSCSSFQIHPWKCCQKVVPMDNQLHLVIFSVKLGFNGTDLQQFFQSWFIETFVSISFINFTFSLNSVSLLIWS